MKIREEFKKLIVMKCHPECKTYEGALLREVELKYCEVEYSNLDGVEGKFVNNRDGDTRYEQLTNNPKIDFYNIIGLPITIGRVLAVLPCEYYSRFHDGYLEWMHGKGEDNVIWKLLEDGKECTDDDQEEEVIQKIYNLFKQV